MRPTSLWMAGGVSALLCWATGTQLHAQDVLVFQGADVVSMTGLGLRPDRTVIVVDGVITEVGAREHTDVPEGATVFDARGRYLAPGLIDMHIHLRGTSELVSYLRHGVTTVVHLSGGLSGAPDILDYRQALEAGELVGPALHASGPILDGDPPINGGVSTPVADSAAALAAVRRQAELGYDAIKVYNRLPTHLLGLVVDEAHRLGLPVFGHVPRPGERSTALQAALAAEMDVIAHAEEFFFTRFYEGVDSLLDRGEVPWRGDDEIDSVVRQVVEAGTAVMPNLSFVAATRTQLDSLDALFDDSEFRFLEPEVQEFWRTGHFGRRDDVERFSLREQAKEEFLDRLTRALARAGVPLLLGTDASFVGLFPGTSAHLELEQLVEAGLSPVQALATGTSTAGRFLFEHGMTDRPVGVVAPGARADLILLEHNPLLDVGAVADPVGVLRGGRWFEQTRLDELRGRR